MATAVRSIRLPVEAWAAIEAEASRLGVTVNALIRDRLSGAPSPTPTARANLPAISKPSVTRLKNEETPIGYTWDHQPIFARKGPLGQARQTKDAR